MANSPEITVRFDEKGMARLEDLIARLERLQPIITKLENAADLVSFAAENIKALAKPETENR